MLIKKQNYLYRIKFYKDGIEILSFPLRHVHIYSYSNGNSSGITTILKEVNSNIINKLANVYNSVYTITVCSKAESVFNVLIKKQNETALLYNTFPNKIDIFLKYQDVILRSDYIEYKYNE